MYVAYIFTLGLAQMEWTITPKLNTRFIYFSSLMAFLKEGPILLRLYKELSLNLFLPTKLLTGTIFIHTIKQMHKNESAS